MAKLIACKSCGKDIAKTAKSCPHCGAPNKRTSAIGGVFVVIVAVTILGAIFRDGEKTGEPSSRISGTRAPSEAAAAKAPEKTVYKTTAQQLFLDYGANEVAADERMKGKVIEVFGTVESIDKSFTDSIVISLSTSNQFMSARLHLTDSEKQKAMRLKKGAKVFFVCESMSRIMGSPSGSDCQFKTADSPVLVGAEKPQLTEARSSTPQKLDGSMALAANNCPISKISVEKFRVQDEGQILTVIIGSIRNKCDIPVGVQLKVIFYDTMDNVLRVEDMWPASVNNIDAHSDYPFQVHLDRVRGFKRVEVRVLRAETW